jgi:hypothetical protein
MDSRLNDIKSQKRLFDWNLSKKFDEELLHNFIEFNGLKVDKDKEKAKK